MAKKRLVGEEVVTTDNNISDLRKGAGENDALKPKGDFGRCPHRRRIAREAEALEVVKAMTKSPGAPELRSELEATHLAGNPAAAGTVYFVYCAGRIKIGYSTNVPQRMTNLATNCPAPVTLLLTIRGDERDEAGYHRMFAADRVHLEWFRLSYELREFMEAQFGHETFPLLFEAECDHLDAVQETTAHVSEMLELH